MKFFTMSAQLISALLISCKPTYFIQKSEQSMYVLSDTSNTTIDSSVYKLILPYKEKVIGTMSVVIAESEFVMERGVPESKLGNFVSDACMHETSKVFYPTDGRPVDFAFFNNGGLRKSLPQGKITLGDVYELMPFENQLVVLSVNGKLVKKIFNFIASKDGAPISGARFQIKEQQGVNITIQNEPLDTTKIYKVLTSDYLANGGDSYDFLIDVPRESVNLKIRDALIQNLMLAGKEGKKIKVILDGRISNER